MDHLKALVTGGAGLIGSHIVDRLVTAGWQVSILDSLELPAHLTGRPDWLNPEAEFFEGSVTDAHALAGAMRGVDVVFHEAAYQGFLPSYSKFWTVNGAGTALIYEVAKEQGIELKKVVIASSQAVYGEGKYRCPEHGLLIPPPRAEEQLVAGDWELRCSSCGSTLECVPTDESEIDPRTMYAQTKYAQETIGFELGRSLGIPTVALRYAITQGPRQSIYHAYSGVCSIFSTRIINDVPPIIYEDGGQLRDYVFVGDVADANIVVATDPRADFEVFNVGTGTSATVLEFLSAINRAFGKSVEPEIPGRYRAGDVRHVRCDNSRLRGLGWTPTHDVADTVSEYVKWITGLGPVVDYFAEAESEMLRLDMIRSVRS